MKLLKPLLLLAVVVGVIIAAVKYTGDSKPALPDDGPAATANYEDAAPANSKPKKDAPRLEERYGFTGEGVGP